MLCKNTGYLNVDSLINWGSNPMTPEVDLEGENGSIFNRGDIETL